MTKEQLKELLPIMQAYMDGKTIQYLDNNGNWQDLEDPAFDSCIMKYRIKPEPKYRPFKTAEECWNEIIKHQPFGWVKDKYAQYINLLSVGDDKDFDHWFATYTFVDGSPFGVNK